MIPAAVKRMVEIPVLWVMGSVERNVSTLVTCI